MNKTLKSLGEFLATPYGLFVHVGMLLFTTGLLIYLPLTVFKTYNEGPVLISAQELEKLEPESKDAAKVETGFTLESFSTFDVNDNEFIALGVVWFIYDPQKVALDKLKQFEFVKGEIQHKSSPLTHRYNKEKKVSRFTVRVKFTGNLNYQDFPLDDHRIFLILKNDYLTSKEVQFVTSPHNVYVEPDHLPATDWSFEGASAESGYSEITIKEEGTTEKIYTNEVAYSFDYNRVGIHLIMLILIPLIFAFFVGLSIFLLQPGEVGAAYRYMLFALVSYLFVLEGLAPKAGYLTLSDYAYFSTFFCSFFILTLGWMSEKMSQAQRGFLGTIVELVLIGLLLFFFHIWR